MKKAILALLVMASGIVASAQITVANKQPSVVVGKVDDGNRRNVTLQYTAEPGKDTVYVIVFLDGRYKQINEYETLGFYSKNGEKDQLYNVFRDLIAASKKTGETQTAEINIGNDNTMCGAFKIASETHLLVMVTGGGPQFVVSEKQLDQLFGKTL